jgi:hypothetical protein
MLTDLTERGLTGDIAAASLEHAGLAVNKNQIPFDPRPAEAPSGLRLSSNAGTTRGFAEPEFTSIGLWIDRVLQDPTDTRQIADVRQEVSALCKQYPIYWMSLSSSRKLLPQPRWGRPFEDPITDTPSLTMCLLLKIDEAWGFDPIDIYGPDLVMTHQRFTYLTDTSCGS